MTSIPFAKYHGLGNDFILIDAIEHPRLLNLDWNSLAPGLCNRRVGIGADGVLVISAARAEHGDAGARMQIFNADGSTAQMCGNGIRCVAAEMARRRGGDRLRIFTDAGVMDIRWAGASPGSAITVNMGVPRLDSSVVPVLTSLEQVVHVPLAALETGEGSTTRAAESLAPFSVDGRARVTCVSFGNPHAVFFVKDPATVPLESLGPIIEKLPIFPQRINVHMASIRSRSHVAMRAWERGSGLTLACGTGACAVLVAGVLTGQLASRARITLPGGDLELEWKQSRAEDTDLGVLMTGPAVEVFRGEFAVG